MIRKPLPANALKLVAPALAVANLTYFLHDALGWTITLGFFLLVPGFLLNRKLQRTPTSRWHTASFSLGLSILVLTVSGLALNSLHAIGVAQPLKSLNVFLTMDIITLILTAYNAPQPLRMQWRWPTIAKEQWMFGALLTLLPLIAAMGAIRLNNGASNVLTLITFGAIAALAFIFICRERTLKALYPYAIVCFGLSLLFAISLRGWYIVGHDVQREFFVFQLTAQHNYWSVTHFRDQYSACLSITLLPTLLARLTSIPDAYIFKLVFQVMFAVGLVPMYLFMQKIGGARRAFIGSFIFISFPTFMTDISMLNRQELAFLFFSLLLLGLFTMQARRARSVMAVLMIAGLILSHYASSYVALGILVLAWVIDRWLARRETLKEPHTTLLSITILGVALLSTFAWNMQITQTSSDFTRSLRSIASGLIDHSSSQSWVASYSLFGGGRQSPAELLSQYAGSQSNDVRYTSQVVIPTTALGRALGHFISPQTFNNLLRSFSAKILQLLLLFGALTMFWRWRRGGIEVAQRRVLALTLSCILLLILQTILPNATVDYGTLRFFLQALIILGVPIIIGMETMLRFLHPSKMLVIGAFFVLLFLDMSGFVPEITGGYVPQLSLNNYGQAYDTYYPHASDVAAANWLFAQPAVQHGTLALDPHMQEREMLGTATNDMQVTTPLLMGSNAYFFQDFTATTKGVYTATINDNVIEYSYQPDVAGRNALYTNGNSTVFSPIGGGQ